MAVSFCRGARAVLSGGGAAASGAGAATAAQQRSLGLARRQETNRCAGSRGGFAQRKIRRGIGGRG